MPPKCGKCGQVCANPLAKRTHEAKCNSSANWTKVERGSDCAERRTVVITSDPPARTQYIPAPAPKVINRKPAVPTAVLAALKSRDEAAAKAKAIADKKAAADAKKAAKAKARADKKEAEQAMYLAEARAEAKAKEDGVKYVRPRRPAVADGSQHQEEELVILDEDEEPDDVQKAPHPDDFWDKERVAAQILLAEEREEEMVSSPEPLSLSLSAGVCVCPNSLISGIATRGGLYAYYTVCLSVHDLDSARGNHSVCGLLSVAFCLWPSVCGLLSVPPESGRFKVSH